MAEDPYKGFAERYDLFDEYFKEHNPEAVEFYRKLFINYEVKSVLDCACGTGKDLLLFHSLGCEVVGSDISDSMLVQAKKNLNKVGLSVPLFKVDYRQLPEHFDKGFDAVACLSTSIAHMENEEEVVKAFKSMYGVLRDGGLLILTQGTTDKQWNEKPRFILAVNKPDFSRLFVIDYSGKGARYNIVDIVHSEEDSNFKVWSVEYPIMYLRDDYERTLMNSGFRCVDFYGSYSLGPYNKKTSNTLIAVAYK